MNMKTIKDILETDLGLVEKTASAQPETTPEVDEMNKLAAELGIISDASESQEIGHNKEANMSLESIYNNAFPGDEPVAGQEKVASDDAMEKEAAAIEEAMGSLAHDAFVGKTEELIEKIAAELVSAAVREEDHPQSMENNEDHSGTPIDTTPQVQDQVLKDKVPGKVGEFSHQSSPNGEQMKAAAVRKHMLKAMLG